MKNIDIRIMVSDNGLTYREVAASMGITACHLSRLMGSELKPMVRERILCAISRCIEAKGKGTE